ncbi:MAG: thrombospondin type 3 repeat-containing protein, partial [Anaerolineales bacterium]|nr:thrombospondin type 3 repeat-containing protein [Anaerolineales bacterium]
INNQWTAQDFRDMAFDATPYDLVLLNSHFDHFRFFPNDNDNVAATEFNGRSSKLILSVGCHSGLNVADNATTLAYTGADFAQTFASQGATFIGNTGFGYGDGDLLAYSERLMLNFTQQLGYNPSPNQTATLPTVGEALMQAKQRYLNSLGNGALTAYDEKVLAEMVLYGLPMLKVEMPTQTSQPPGGGSRLGAATAKPLAIGAATTAITENLSFSYQSHQINQPERSGTYYTVNGGTDLQVTGNRPVLPMQTLNYASADEIVRGVLMTGGSFTDTPNFNPVIAQLIDQEVTLPGEGIYLAQTLYPQHVVSVNRFLTVDGTYQQRVIVVPAQFRTTSATAPTVGTLRRYSSLNLVVYTAPASQTDYMPPNIWSVAAEQEDRTFTIRVGVGDEQTAVNRVLILYRPLDQNSWSSLDLTYDEVNRWATGSITASTDSVEFFVQAVDTAGNVALALDHGQPFYLLTNAGDSDNDAVGDASDNCPFVANSSQADLDGDGLGDVCDLNKDGDPMPDPFDTFPQDDGEWFDSDGDGQGDNSDSDADNDGVNNGSDNCPTVANSNQADFDHDDMGNACDVDDDNDGAADTEDAFPLDSSRWSDMDSDGVADGGSSGTEDNCPFVPNPDQADSNNNGV